MKLLIGFMILLVSCSKLHEKENDKGNTPRVDEIEDEREEDSEEGEDAERQAEDGAQNSDTAINEGTERVALSELEQIGVWKKVSVPEWLEARWNASVVAKDDWLLVHGGFDRNWNRVGSAGIYDLKKKEWEKISQDGEPFPKGQALFVEGGFIFWESGESVEHRLKYYRFDTKVWSPIPSDLSGKLIRMFSYNRKLITITWTSVGVKTNIFSLDSNSWTDVPGLPTGEEFSPIFLRATIELRGSIIHVIWPAAGEGQDFYFTLDLDGDQTQWQVPGGGNTKKRLGAFCSYGFGIWDAGKFTLPITKAPGPEENWAKQHLGHLTYDVEKGTWDEVDGPSLVASENNVYVGDGLAVNDGVGMFAGLLSLSQKVENGERRGVLKPTKMDILFDSKTSAWKRSAIEGRPPARGYYSVSAYSGGFVVSGGIENIVVTDFGGWDPGELSSDIYLLKIR